MVDSTPVFVEMPLSTIVVTPRRRSCIPRSVQWNTPQLCLVTTMSVSTCSSSSTNREYSGEGGLDADRGWSTPVRSISPLSKPNATRTRTTGASWPGMLTPTPLRAKGSSRNCATQLAAVRCFFRSGELHTPGDRSWSPPRPTASSTNTTAPLTRPFGRDFGTIRAL